eukprot:5381178-Amphidinium_carterae.1
MTPSSSARRSSNAAVAVSNKDSFLLEAPAASDGGTATFFAADGRRVTMISSPAQQTQLNQAGAVSLHNQPPSRKKPKQERQYPRKQHNNST